MLELERDGHASLHHATTMHRPASSGNQHEPQEDGVRMRCNSGRWMQNTRRRR
jgi:hypothetical protein